MWVAAKSSAMSRDYGSLGTLDFADWALRRTRYGQSRAVLLVDHNVKGAAALVDRVLAMSHHGLIPR